LMLGLHHASHANNLQLFAAILQAAEASQAKKQLICWCVALPPRKFGPLPRVRQPCHAHYALWEWEAKATIWIVQK
jgi:hypothetical protein